MSQVRALRALVVEDDRDISSLLMETLSMAGFEVAAVADGVAAVDAVTEFQPDLVTLDLALPRMDGVEVCRHIRERSDCYIVMVTARVDEVDRLVGLEVGADDYVLKPFSPRELRARVAALFRRPRAGNFTVPTQARAEGVRAPTAGTAPDVIDGGGGLVINRPRREVEILGRVVDLTRTEYDVLDYLATRISTVCTREAIVEAVWHSGLETDRHLVDVHVANLRTKLRRRSPNRWIHTVRGVGYRFDVAEDVPAPTWDLRRVR